MRDDVSSINTSGCNVLTSPNTIINYQGATRREYTQNGGKWYLYRSTYSSYSYDISGYNCINVNLLNSNAQFEPIFYAIGFMLLVSLVLLLKWVFGGLLRAFK